MLDINFILENLDLVKEGAKNKNVQVDFDALLSLDSKRRQLIQEVDQLRNIKNSANQEVASLQGDAKKEAIAKLQKTAQDEKEKAAKLSQVESDWKDIMLTIPNPPSSSVPIGKDETENVVIKTFKEIPKFDFQPKDHETLGILTDTIDKESARTSSGARFTYLKNEAVLIQFGLVQHIMQKLVKQGFIPVIPPVLVREEAMTATGFFPADRNEIYSVNPDDDDLYLVGTSEVPLTMMHYKDTLDSSKLPIRYVGYSSCFRREAGSYGKDEAGIIRLHQFDKLEMYSFCNPNNSEEEHEFIRNLEEEILQDLEIPYQVINICSGDLGNPAAKKYDIEAWIPSQNQYRELTSTSNCTDFQARRSHIKYKNTKGKTDYLHTLNGTASAIGRTIVAIYENYQQADGSIKIPTILQPYVGTDTIKVKERHLLTKQT